jgi:hypothetical protein
MLILKMMLVWLAKIKTSLLGKPTSIIRSIKIYKIMKLLTIIIKGVTLEQN